MSNFKWERKPNKPPKKSELREMINFAITDDRYHDIQIYVDAFTDAQNDYLNERLARGKTNLT